MGRHETQNISKPWTIATRQAVHAEKSPQQQQQQFAWLHPSHSRAAPILYLHEMETWRGGLMPLVINVYQEL